MMVWNPSLKGKKGNPEVGSVPKELDTQLGCVKNPVLPHRALAVLLKIFFSRTAAFSRNGGKERALFIDQAFFHGKSRQGCNVVDI